MFGHCLSVCYEPYFSHASYLPTTLHGNKTPLTLACQAREARGSVPFDFRILARLHPPRFPFKALRRPWPSVATGLVRSMGIPLGAKEREKGVKCAFSGRIRFVFRVAPCSCGRASATSLSTVPCWRSGGRPSAAAGAARRTAADAPPPGIKGTQTSMANPNA